VGSGYRPLCDAVNAFVALGKLPADIQSVVQYWDEGDGYEATFMQQVSFCKLID